MHTIYTLIIAYGEWEDSKEDIVFSSFDLSEVERISSSLVEPIRAVMMNNKEVYIPEVVDNLYLSPILHDQVTLFIRSQPIGVLGHHVSTVDARFISGVIAYDDDNDPFEQLDMSFGDEDDMPYIELGTFIEDKLMSDVNSSKRYYK